MKVIGTHALNQGSQIREKSGNHLTQGGIKRTWSKRLQRRFSILNLSRLKSSLTFKVGTVSAEPLLAGQPAHCLMTSIPGKLGALQPSALLVSSKIYQVLRCVDIIHSLWWLLSFAFVSIGFPGLKQFFLFFLLTFYMLENSSYLSCAIFSVQAFLWKVSEPFSYDSGLWCSSL